MNRDSWGLVGVVATTRLSACGDARISGTEARVVTLSPEACASFISWGSSRDQQERNSRGGTMRSESRTAARRVLRSCNLLPNVDRSIVFDRMVLRLVISVATSWGNLQRLCAAGRRTHGPAVNRSYLSRILSDAICLWGVPAPAAQTARVRQTAPHRRTNASRPRLAPASPCSHWPS